MNLTKCSCGCGLFLKENQLEQNTEFLFEQINSLNNEIVLLERANDRLLNLINREKARVTAERGALRAEVEAMRAVVEEVMTTCDAECPGCGAYWVAKKHLDALGAGKADE